MAVVQGIVAGLLVLASGLYAAWRLTPATGRVRLLGWVKRTPVGSGGWLAKLRAAVEDGTGGCGGCGAGQVRSRPGATTRTPGAPRR